METLKNNIKVVTMIPLTVHNGDSDTGLDGSAVDMYVTSDGPAFDTALVTAVVGAVGADVSAATIKIEESDASDFGSGVTTCEGGDAVSVLAGDDTFSFQVKRTKRYIRAALEVEEDGAADDVELAVTAVLTNWALPMPTL